MVSLLATIVVVIGLILVYYYIDRHNTPVISTFDGRVYHVLKDIQDPVESANILARLNANVEKLIQHLKKDYKEHSVTRCLSRKYVSSIISEARIQRGYTTYTINKSDIRVCIRTRDNNKKAYDINLLMYVLLHELAHVCNDTIGHDNNFKRIFSFLVQQAINAGVYTFDDYNSNPQEYCGLTLNSSIL